MQQILGSWWAELPNLLLGFFASGGKPAPKATGGTITDDGAYYYHTFTSSGTFAPLVSLSADILAVAGGAGACVGAGNTPTGAGGAGGLIVFTSQSLTVQNYTCTIGGGGAGTASNTSVGNGADSQFGSLTLIKGGGGGGHTDGVAGKTGGSGGGGMFGGAGGAATTGQGSAGGSAATSGNQGSGGGGGKGGAAGAGTSTAGGAGGIGYYDAIVDAMGASASKGELSGGHYYFAGGGGGSTYNGGTPGTGGLGGGGDGRRQTVAENGAANTGGGGGGTGDYGTGTGANGGSGIIIVRYPF